MPKDGLRGYSLSDPVLASIREELVSVEALARKTDDPAAKEAISKITNCLGNLLRVVDQTISRSNKGSG